MAEASPVMSVTSARPVCKVQLASLELQVSAEKLVQKEVLVRTVHWVHQEFAASEVNADLPVDQGLSVTRVRPVLQAILEYKVPRAQSVLTVKFQAQPVCQDVAVSAAPRETTVSQASKAR